MDKPGDLTGGWQNSTIQCRPVLSNAAFGFAWYGFKNLQMAD